LKQRKETEHYFRETHGNVNFINTFYPDTIYLVLCFFPTTYRPHRGAPAIQSIPEVLS